MSKEEDAHGYSCCRIFNLEFRACGRAGAFQLFYPSNVFKHHKFTPIIFANWKHLIASKWTGSFNISFISFVIFVISFIVHRGMRQRKWYYFRYRAE